jgi:hypothetical protein
MEVLRGVTVEVPCGAIVAILGWGRSMPSRSLQ